MFDRSSGNRFQNRQHIGDFTEISFDIALDDQGEEIENVKASLHYLRFGEGDPLILLHGLGQSMFTWRKCFYMLEENFTVYAIDLPGHGCSEKAAMAYAVEDFSLSIETFIMQEHIGPAHIVTFGETASYALDLAIQRPDLVKSLIFVSPMMERNDPKGGCYAPFVSTCGKFLFSKKNFTADLEAWFFDKTLLTDFLIDEYWQPYEDKEFKQILKVAGANYNDIELKENITRVKAPMLIVRGLDDRLSPPMEEGLGGLPLLKAKAFTIRNCGWLVQEEKPEKLCAAIEQFIALTENNEDTEE